MNISEVKSPKPRLSYPNIDNLKILGYGENNVYPQEIRDIIDSSESGSSCLDRYIGFIQGNGFLDEEFAELKVNRQGDTNDDILNQIANDLGTWSGFALHVNYNINGQIVEINHVPWENCRLGEEDDIGYIGKIAVFPDWTGKRKRNKKLLKPKAEDIDYIDIFNPDPLIVLLQIESAGGIDNYKGQILWISAAGKYEYPKAKCDCVITQMSTEEGLANISYRNARNSFLPSQAIVIKKGQSNPNTENKAQEEDTSLSGFTESFSKLQGDMSSSKLVVFEVEYDEEIPQAINLQSTNYDKEFTVTSDATCEKIYAAFNQEAWHRIRKGSIGFSSDIMRDAYDVYSSVTGPERRMIERAFDKIYKYWYQQLPKSNYTVQPLKYISDNIENDMVTWMYEKDLLTKNNVLNSVGIEGIKDGDIYLSASTNVPLAVRLGVSGTQALQAILIDTEMTNEAKIGTLEVLFSLTKVESEKLVLGDKQTTTNSYETPDNNR